MRRRHVAMRGLASVLAVPQAVPVPVPVPVPVGVCVLPSDSCHLYHLLHIPNAHPATPHTHATHTPTASPPMALWYAVTSRAWRSVA